MKNMTLHTLKKIVPANVKIATAKTVRVQRIIPVHV